VRGDKASQHGKQPPVPVPVIVPGFVIGIFFDMLVVTGHEPSLSVEGPHRTLPVIPNGTRCAIGIAALDSAVLLG